jgi:hypothetical protein
MNLFRRKAGDEAELSLRIEVEYSIRSLLAFCDGKQSYSRTSELPSPVKELTPAKMS